MLNRVKGWMAAITTFISLVAVLLPVCAPGEQAPADKAAIVNGEVITKREFNRELTLLSYRLMQTGQVVTDTQRLKIKGQVLESLINRELLFQESRLKEIKVEPPEVQEQLSKLRERYPTEDAYRNLLAMLNMTEPELKTHIGRSIAIQKLMDKQFAHQISISDKEAKAYYESNPDAFKQSEQVRARHILIAVEPKADDKKKAAAREKTEEIRNRLEKGEDFAALARELSDCPSASRGGDLGYFGRGQMIQPIEEAAFALNPGELSPVIETTFGYHLIKVIDKKPAGTIPYDEVKDKLKAHLEQKEVEKQAKSYVEELKKEAVIERFLSGSP